MKEHIWSRVGMTRTTFQPGSRTDYPLLELGTRVHGPYEPLTPIELSWPRAPKDNLGGGGAFSCAADYAKLLASLVSNDGMLLKSESIDELVRPQLSDESREGLLRARDLGLVQTDIPAGHAVDHGLGGLLVLEDIPGRRKAMAINWDGMTNPQWVSRMVLLSRKAV